MLFKDPRLKFSLVIPVYKEKESVALLYMSLKQVMDRLGQTYEIIFVDDCSRDGTFEALSSIDTSAVFKPRPSMRGKGIPLSINPEQTPGFSLGCVERIDLSPANLIVVGLSKRGGQSVALQAGFDLAQGELIITMDGDLQNDPEDIVSLEDKMIQGDYDIVCGWRYKRKDPLGKLFASKIACALRRAITKESVHDFGCSFRIFKKTVLNNVYFSAGMHRFFVLIMHKLGYKIGELKVKHNPRRFGNSKYNLCNRLFECLIDFMRILLLGTPETFKNRTKYQVERIVRK